MIASACAVLEQRRYEASVRRADGITFRLRHIFSTSICFVLMPVFNALHLRCSPLFAAASLDPMRQMVCWLSFLPSCTDLKTWNGSKN